MARTPLLGRLQEAASIAREATERGVPVDEVLGERLEGRVTRRGLLAGAAAGGLAVSGLGRFAPLARAATTPQIVVVGGGLAGLTCAYRLGQAGLAAQLHEASDRLGGRCWTIRGAFAEGQIAEHGGELIDQGHTAMRNLVQELGLDLDNLLAAQPNGTEDFFRFDGAPYSFAAATDDLKSIWQKLHKDVSAASYPTTYYQSTERGRQLDRMSIVDWLNDSIPFGGAGSKLGQFLNVAYNIEYGAESSVQSSLNLLYLLGYVGPGQFQVFGKSNEKYHVVGGNDQVPQRLVEILQREMQITPGSELVAIKRNGDGTYTLTFKEGSSTKTVGADHVVLALPFSRLRLVDYSQAGFGDAPNGDKKLLAIQKLAMGTNSKLHLQFASRHWYSLGNNGNTYADTGYQNTWEVTRAQPGTAGILVDYTGGTIGASFGSGTPASRAQQFLTQLEPVLPGIAAKWNGKVTRDFWKAYPWTLGSYSYWKVGQYTQFSGAEKERSFNCHFAGEHTSQDFQGYLNGAVETGERAAGEILGDLK
jgi:monoamine oxidase